MRSLKLGTFGLAGLILLALCATRQARADVSLLLEEPYGHFGAFTATGHAAVYLTRVCAETPVVLRRCEDGENGVVISRYDKVGGYDWIAIPLVPYLYAVEDQEDIPLYANPKLVAFLRNEYRKKYLENIVPDAANGEPPEGNWTQLAGASYDRTIYGFKIETSEEQDDRFIREYNSRENQSHFNLLSQNCADFSRGVIDFYFPRAVHRSLVADLGITTPKQIAKSLVKFSERHSDLEFSRYVIPQVPGSVARSKPVHGVVVSMLKSKDYMLPVVILHPVVAGCLVVAAVGLERFDPAKGAMVSEAGPQLEPPMASTERRAYRDQLALWTRENPAVKARRNEKVLAQAEPEFDGDGHPMLKLRLSEEEVVGMGVSRGNILGSDSSPVFAQQLLAERLHEELKSGNTAKVSQAEVSSDWKLLQQVIPAKAGLD